jgi:hypothetical protein
VQTQVIKSIAGRLLQRQVLSIESLGGGRNSQVYRVVDATRRAYALKLYFRHPTDDRDRLGTEFNGLRFLWRHGVRGIPEPLAADPAQGCALYEYVEGRTIPPAEVSAVDIEAALSFLARLKDLCQQPESRDLPLASEACFSGQALLGNLQGRLDRLLGERPGEAGDPAFRRFLADEFSPALGAITRWSSSRLSLQEELPWSERTLSPSDFGFHNALRRGNGEPVFLDFEYFGWDDPAKTLSDFLLHPAMELSDALKRQFAGGLQRRLAEDSCLAERVKCVYPLFGLKWCLILLNEFLPEHMLRRRFAATAGSRQAVQAEQLSKARVMLQRVCREYEQFPYFG